MMQLQTAEKSLKIHLFDHYQMFFLLILTIKVSLLFSIANISI